MQLMVSGSESDMQDEDVLSKKRRNANKTGEGRICIGLET